MELLQRSQSLFQECNDIVASLEAWKEANPTLEVDGLQKMTSALHAEQKFLEKVASTPAEEIKTVQISSSNVPYLKSLVWALIRSRNPVAVRKTFTYSLDPFTVIEPSEKFKALPTKQGQATSKGVRGRESVMKLSTSQPLSSALANEQTFQVKVDVVADHGKSWLRINAGSVWSLIHEFAGMEDDSDAEEEDEEEEEDEADSTKQLSDSNGWRSIGHTRLRKPVHVSKDTHPDMTLLIRSLVLAADQNRLHYSHRPLVQLRFAGILPEESPALETMIHKAVHVGRVAQSIEDGIVQEFPVKVVFGPVESQSSPSIASSTPLDPTYAPFAIPTTVDDMVLFTKTLHLDITTLMALSSYLCHSIRPDPTLFTSPPLILQAQQEHDQPLLPLLAKIFEGRERLVMCRTAATRFKAILNVIGGPEEKWRGQVMIHDPLEEVEAQENEARIKERWFRGSDWASHYGVFADGPPRIDVIEDMLGSTMPTAQTAQELRGEQTAREDIPDSGPSSPTLASIADSNASSSSVASRRELNMTELHTKIFLTGHNAHLTTLTANQVGYRTVTRMGQVPTEMSVWSHAPRSLAEAKLPPGTLAPRPA